MCVLMCKCGISCELFVNWIYMQLLMISEIYVFFHKHDRFSPTGSDNAPTVLFVLAGVGGAR